jgi:hypothetical protein
MENKSNIGCVRLSHEEFYEITKESYEKRKKLEDECIISGRELISKIGTLPIENINATMIVWDYHNEKRINNEKQR